MLTYASVMEASLAKLKAAVDDWAEMKTRLDRLTEDARTRMAAKAKDEDWQGTNAGVAKPFIDKTAKEFGDAAKAADGIHKILQEGYQAFKKAQDDLKKITDTDAPAQGLVVRFNGTVEAVHPVAETSDPRARNDPDHRDLVRREEQAIGAVRRRIDAILDTCNEADVACSNALKADVTTDQHDFSTPKYTSLDAEEADRALELAKKGKELTHKELERLNELLADNSGSKAFARAFYDGLGPKGALEFFGRLSVDTRNDDGELDKQRVADVQDLQKNLGLNLAQATQGGDQWAETWSRDLRKLGAQPVPLGRNDFNPPYGYQLLGGILRNGDYSPAFLKPIAEHVTQLHAKDPNMFGNNVTNSWMKNPYNPAGENGAGFDPMISVLEALGHSPEAAKQFFLADPPTAYNEDGSVNRKAVTPSTSPVDLYPDDEGKSFSGYLDFFQDAGYKSFPDTPGRTQDDSATYLPDALGHALEAATTGHAWDDPGAGLKRDADTAKIMKEVIEDYGSDSELMERHEALTDSLGRMGAAYIDDLNYSVLNFGDSGDQLGRDRIFSHSSDGKSPTDFGYGQSVAFMTKVAGDEEAYRAISAAQQAFTAGGMGVLGGDRDDALTFAHNSLKVHGVLDESRVSQIAEDFKDEEDQRNLELEKQGEWRKALVGGGVGAAVGLGTGLLVGPAAGAVTAVVVPMVVENAGGAVNTSYATHTLQYLKDNEFNNDTEAGDAIRRAREAGQNGAMLPLINYVDDVGMSFKEKDDFFREAEDSYGRGVRAAGDELKVKA
ncbi:hypothetical protein SLA_2679 [Streptomyces laurentii]|uniref:AG2 protein n=1 Tax=Streptomyces laurentii TaxID=39478 RepID=A0A160P034_STRLU|nr:hypothetical protein SLA_2679 [Streptomyces laurentii]